MKPEVLYTLTVTDRHGVIDVETHTSRLDARLAMRAYRDCYGHNRSFRAAVEETRDPVAIERAMRERAEKDASRKAKWDALLRDKGLAR